METKPIYQAPLAEIVHLSHECALMQTSANREDPGKWITDEWEN